MSSKNKIDKQKLLQLALGPNTAYPKNKSVIDVFEEIVKKHPKNIALRFFKKSMSYEELNHKANQLARHLQKLGVKKQDYVGIYLHRSIDLFVGILGILKAGAIYVPIDADYPKQRKLYMIDDTKLNVLITDPAFAKQFPKRRLHFLFLKETNINQYQNSNLHLKIDPLNLAYINYTSGTTGNPKGVQIAHRNINRLVLHPNWIQFTSNDRFLQISNISFDALTHELWGALLNGATLCIYPQINLSPDELGKFIVQEKVTQVIFTARLFNLMVDEALESLKGLRAMCSVGDVMSAKHAKIAFKHLPSSCKIINACGHTENTTHTTAYTVTNRKAIQHEVPIGRPINHTTVYILDEKQQLVPFGSEGELCTGGDGVARGYLNRPDLTAEKFILNPFGKGHLYRTGDLVRYLPDSNLSFLGRIDTQVKIRGFRIELSELEEAVRSFPLISDSVAMSLVDPSGEKQLVVYAEAKQKKPKSHEIRDWIASKLPSYAIPNFIIVLERLPMTPNGKVDRKNLPSPFLEEKKETILHTETEKTIADLWSKILHRTTIDRTDHFFKIGGDSIHAMQIASQLKRTFQREISAALLFQHPILADLASAIDLLKKSESKIITKQDIASPLPISYHQESLWLIDRLGPHTKLQYMVLYAYRIEGKINTSKLYKSLEEILQRHEILRTRFIEKNKEILQVIEPKSRNYFLKFSKKNTKDALSLLKQKMLQGMDLSQLPLLQVLLIKIRPNLHLLGIRVHHIIFDVLSFQNFFKEWTSLYASKELESLPIQYGDYALWQRERLKNPKVKNQLTFWKNHLRGAPELLELPWDKPRPPQFLGVGSSEGTHFPKHLSAALKDFATKQGTTLSILLFAAFKVLLYRYSGQEDIVVGTPFANRTRQELDPLIGYFLQMFVLRSDCSNNPSFTSFLSKLNQNMSECYKNSDIPLEWIVNALNPIRNPSFNPIFQVLFVYENITKAPIRFETAKLHPISCETNTAKFDLSLFIYDKEEGLECKFEYSTDLFEKQTIQRMFSHFHTLLESILKNPNETIGLLPMLTKEERKQILRTCSPTKIHYPRHSSVPELFEETAEKWPHKEALRFSEKTTTYIELNQKANQLARYLQKCGVKKHDFVGIYLERSDNLAIALLAILKLGAVYVPIDESYPDQRKQYMIEHTGLKVLITHHSFTKKFSQKNIHLIDLEDKNFTTLNNANLNEQINPFDLAYINYTSGSTGQPKGVEYTHLGIIRLLKNPRWMKLKETDRMLQISNISFDMLAAEVWGALLNGATLCIYPQKRFSPSELGAFILQEKVSHLYLTARLFVLMVEEALSSLKKVRVFASTGEAMSAQSATVAYQKLPSCQILNVYGPTENHITTTYTVTSESSHVPIGRPVEGTQVYVLDAHRQLVPIGVYGELYAGGDGLARGYLKDPIKTDEKFISNPFGQGKLYRTGDLVRLLPDGNLDYLGRLDTQVKILGFRIELSEVEGVIQEHESVADCIVVAQKTGHHENHLVVYIEKKETKTLHIDEIRAYTAKKLPKYAIPSHFVLVEKFPLTPNGKIDKKKLPLPKITSKQKASQSPLSFTEQILSEIWSRLLKVPNIDRHDDFFHIGGHSILAMQLNSILRKEFQIEIPISLIFEESTLEKYAHRIDQLRIKGTKSKTQHVSFDSWRNQEAILDPTIHAKAALPTLPTQYSHPKKIFLTGATGFVGAFFLKELIEKTDAKIYCLVRANTKQEALQRIKNTLKQYSIWKPKYQHRMIAVPGSLEKPLLGLDPKEFQKISKEIDSIFHIGAFVNHAMSYERHKMANVFGTQEILRLSSTYRLKPLHFISTIAVVDGIKKEPISEDADIEKSKNLSNGYVQSKWVAEKLILIARRRGIPCTIFRLPRVSGDSKIGSGPTSDFLWRLIQASLILKTAPRVDFYDDLTPVDYICRAIHSISKNPEWINSQFHVISPRPILYMSLFKLLKKFGYSLTFTDLSTWQKILINESIEKKDEKLQALASLLADVDPTQSTKILILGCDHLKSALKKEKLKCPKIDEKLFKKYVNYYIKIGFLNDEKNSSILY